MYKAISGIMSSAMAYHWWYFTSMDNALSDDNMCQCFFNNRAQFLGCAKHDVFVFFFSVGNSDVTID